MNATASKIDYQGETVGTSSGRIEPGGHRVFFSRMTGSYALADNSGTRPELTDDGPLWINTAALKEVGNIQIEIDKNGKVRASIPVFKGDVPPTFDAPGYYVGVGVDGAAWLARQFSVGLEIVTTHGTIGTLVITSMWTKS